MRNIKIFYELCGFLFEGEKKLKEKRLSIAKEKMQVISSSQVLNITKTQFTIPHVPE